MTTLYLWVDILSIGPPLFLSFHPRMRLQTRWWALWPAIAIAAIIFILFDSLYTSLGVWGFNPEYLTGIGLGNLPLAEMLFFICIPYACLFSYHCLNTLLPGPFFQSAQRSISLVLMIASVFFVLFNHSRLYTIFAFSSAFIMVGLAEFVFRSAWLHRFYFAYLFLQVPFLIVNGILTGTGLDRPVVWYNSEHHIGWRILTIPFEDVFYGMSMLMLSVMLYEYFLQRRTIKTLPHA